MKKFLLSAACLLGMAISASAADLAARPYTKAPVMVADVYNWTGFYIGGNVGYSWGRSVDTSTLANGAGTVLFTSFDSTNLDGIVGGGQIGYNWQSQSLVWGLEADIQGTDEKGSRAFTCPTGICTPFVPIVFNGIGVPVARIQITFFRSPPDERQMRAMHTSTKISARQIPRVARSILPGPDPYLGG